MGQLETRLHVVSCGKVYFVTFPVFLLFFSLSTTQLLPDLSLFLSVSFTCPLSLPLAFPSPALLGAHWQIKIEHLRNLRCCDACILKAPGSQTGQQTHRLSYLCFGSSGHESTSSLLSADSKYAVWSESSHLDAASQFLT